MSNPDLNRPLYMLIRWSVARNSDLGDFLAIIIDKIIIDKMYRGSCRLALAFTAKGRAS